VVGDGCTDDSESVVNSFGDPRFRWHNLPRNYGSQYAPNNYGLENAAADWVAYLGQDDVWYPTHLETCMRAAQSKEADFVASVMIMYGPLKSDFRAISGVFVDGVHSPRDFTPPSSVMHRRSLIERIGFWRPPDVTELPVDCDFFKAIAGSGARITSTGELTVFKVNAAWRRDSYKLKDTTEQEAFLARIEDGLDFRQEELIEVVRAVAADKYVPTEMPKAAPPGTYHRRWRKHKGAERWYAAEEMQSLSDVRRFGLGNEWSVEWHGEEKHPTFGTFRWSGPLPRASTSLPVYFDQSLFFRMHVITAIDQALLTSLKILVQDREVSFKSEMTPSGTHMFTWSSAPSADADPKEPLSVTVDTALTRRPRDLGINQDRRWLGVAVNWIEIGPVAAVSDG
jgi:glycosyltransferase involved in cell wall biosynthesis